jgi:ectoine hydroxylase-related dioxygenase (phytanoyl-CoA dioxygenase family)
MEDDEVSHLPESASADDVVSLLRVHGCAIIDALIPGDSIEGVRSELKGHIQDAPFGDNDFDGYATRRVFDPFARTRVLDDLVLHPLLVETVRAVIGPHQFGMTEFSDVKPGEVAQRLHRDAGIYPLPVAFGPVEINTIWAIDDFTRSNGATVLSLGSHLRETQPSEYQAEPLCAATMSAGSVLVYDGRLIHGAGRNHTSTTRLGMIIEHVVRWLRPAENHTLTIAPEVALTLSPALRERLGYNQHSPYLGFVNGRSPEQWLSDRTS